ncbi:AAA family ATPase [Tissierella creatinophila]|uniref:Chromosome segregation protein n=1 Tax=Tissierella creatinophila DSM 6911 TaxID=1123403 RepID=A0A1U7M9K2_TISCR|nr:ATPase [Tissierella creatinophila]OLS03977.1 chromosome segregation protein [Tissierella creatinophila DSM 6911]
MIKDINELDRQIEKLKTYTSRELGKREKLDEQLNLYLKDYSYINSQIELLEKVVILFQKTSEFARNQAKSQIENLVTKCLQFIFESNVKFTIELEDLRNKANAEFYVVDETEHLQIKTKPELSRGGGVVDIISLALRIAFLQIHKPSIQGPLILDEPAKHVSQEFINNVGEFLKQTSEMFNRQIIMITHDNYLASLSDRSYKVNLIDTVSIVKQIEE